VAEEVERALSCCRGCAVHGCPCLHAPWCHNPVVRRPAVSTLNEYDTTSSVYIFCTPKHIKVLITTPINIKASIFPPKISLVLFATPKHLNGSICRSNIVKVLFATLLHKPFPNYDYDCNQVNNSTVCSIVHARFCLLAVLSRAALSFMPLTCCCVPKEWKG
jgi:hypothetical protein